MTTNARSVPLPAYPAILLRAKQELSKAEQERCFEALVTHYGLAAEFGHGLAGLARVMDGGSRATRDAWPRLAIALISDFVPAFRIPRKPGRPKTKAGPTNYLGFLLAGFSPADAEAYAQALFVKVVREAQGSKSREAAYRRLESDAKLRSKLPECYKSLKKRGAFRQMWKKIPPAIQNDPDDYLQPPSERGLLGIPKSALEKMLAGQNARAGSK